MTLRRAPTLNLPNQLTVLRLGMCGLLLISMSFTWRYAATTAFFIFTLASVTDWLDGAIARARNLVTDLGKLLDPLADKVLVVSALAALLERGVAPMWMVVLIITRELLIMGLRQIAAAKQQILAAERIGKHKTISQIVAILVSLACLSLGEFGLQNTLLAKSLSAAQPYLYWIALVITVVSGAVYFWRNAAVVNESLAAKELVPATPNDASLAPVSISSSASTPIDSSSAEPATVSTRAFKEWAAIVEALGHGAQILILRKGGIAEGRAGFDVKHPKFWLFPTAFHQQWESTKPDLRRFAAPVPQTDEIVVQYFAEVTDAVYLETWEQVARLDDSHFWNEAILRERFDYKDRPGMEAGLHLLIVRVSRVNLPHRLAASPKFAGCKSWLDLPIDWTHDISAHVVRAEEFATRRSRILAAVSTVAISSASGPLPKLAPKLTPKAA